MSGIPVQDSNQDVAVDDGGTTPGGPVITPETPPIGDVDGTNILSAFKALLDLVFEGRAFRNTVPGLPATPYARFLRAATVESVTLDDNGGTGNGSNTRIQVDIYGTADELDAKASLVKSALRNWHVENVVLLHQDGYDPELQLHRSTLDVSIWHQ